MLSARGRSTCSAPNSTLLVTSPGASVTCRYREGRQHVLSFPEAVPVPHVDLGAANGAGQGGQGRGRHGAVHDGVLGPRRHASQSSKELSAVQGIT